MRLIFLVALLVAATGVRGDPIAETAAELAIDCAKMVKAPKRTFETGYCAGVFRTMNSINVLLDRGHGKGPTGLGLCSGGHYPTEAEMAAIFVAYAAQNTRELNENFGYIVIKALRATYPC